jgi:hypothetical protein
MGRNQLRVRDKEKKVHGQVPMGGPEVAGFKRILENTHLLKVKGATAGEKFPLVTDANEGTEEHKISSRTLLSQTR